MVIENLIAAAGERRTPHFFRTQDGAGIDLLLLKGGAAEFAIEIKRASAPALDRGFAIACENLGVSRRFLVYPGTERLPVRHGTEAISLAEMTALLRG